MSATAWMVWMTRRTFTRESIMKSPRTLSPRSL
jgi:hypothetical protein